MSGSGSGLDHMPGVDRLAEDLSREQRSMLKSLAELAGGMDRSMRLALSQAYLKGYRDGLKYERALRTGSAEPKL